jgi:hypothetical protein
MDVDDRLRARRRRAHPQEIAMLALVVPAAAARRLGALKPTAPSTNADAYPGRPPA